MGDASATNKNLYQFAAGTVLFREGDVGQEMYVVQSGLVRISVHVRGVEKVLVDLGTGEFFGEMSILNAAPRSATATVVQDAELVIVSPESFGSMLRRKSEIAVRMIKKLAGRLQEADEQISNLLLRDHNSRVAHALLNLARRQRADDAGGFTISMTELVLASKTGLLLVELAEVLDRLETAGLVERIDGGFYLAKFEPLADYLGVLEMSERFARARAT